jgi:hypothetical protein
MRDRSWRREVGNSGNAPVEMPNLLGDRLQSAARTDAPLQTNLSSRPERSGEICSFSYLLALA